MNSKIAQVVPALPLEGPFDYLIPESLRDKIKEGSRVYVPFHFRKQVGFVVGLRANSAVKELKAVSALLDNVPALSSSFLRLTKQFAQYYGCSWGQAIETSLPTALRKKTELRLECSQHPALSAPKPGEVILCHDQGTTQRWPFLIERIRETLSKGMSVIFLVPQVAGIERVQRKLKEQISEPIAVLDKKLKSKAELEEWIAVREGRRGIVLGTRSAVFAPVNNLGLIIIDDEDNPFYKQEQSPFYHARDVSRMRREIEGGSIIFVASVPTSETWWQAKQKKARLQTFPADHLANLQIVDLSQHKRRKKGAISLPLESHIQATLAKKGRVLLFLNRKGFSTMTRCNQCGFTMKCPRCDVALSYLFAKKSLVCHLCNLAVDLPKICPHCKSTYLRSTGQGIEKIESEMARVFPQARVARFDRESRALPPKTDILITTQAICPHLGEVRPDLAGILDVDTQLNRPDFRSAQRLLSLLTLFRQNTQERVVVQTYNGENYCLKAASVLDFKKFYAKEIKLHRELGLPPFGHFVEIGLREKRKDMVSSQADELYGFLNQHSLKSVEIFGPQPDFLPKMRDQYRFKIMAKGKSLPRIFKCIKAGLKSFRRKSNVLITLHVDP